MNIQNPELLVYRPEVIASPAGEMLGVRFDVLGLLEAKIGPDWQHEACELIEAGNEVVRTGRHHTVREAEGRFGLVSIEGEKFAEEMPGVWELYQGVFKQMMQAALPAGLEPLNSYDDPHLALEPVSQLPADPATGIQRRYEAHVDQRYTGVLVLAAPQSGGRLVIANNPAADSLEAINSDATYITHRPGTLFVFSRGRFYPHYTEEITDPGSKRVTISLNYPVEGETLEEAHELVDHAYGKHNGDEQ